MRIITYTDGGSRGNPGPAAYGVSITNEKGQVLTEFGEKIGINTNNVAEYTAIIKAFSWILAHKGELDEITEIEARMDSQLACRQLTGIYKVKNDAIRGLYHRVQLLVDELALPILYNHIPREQNTAADRQVNLALDN